MINREDLLHAIKGDFLIDKLLLYLICQYALVLQHLVTIIGNL